MPPFRIFLLSPAHYGGKRAELLLSERAALPEAFSFLSGLYLVVGDMSRGALLLRAARNDAERTCQPVAGAIRRGARARRVRVEG
jgi:hypothetical protein